MFSLSCEENISYLGDFAPKYSLNCILRADKEIQYATIKKSYAAGEDNQDTNIQNAIIRLILPDTTFQFKDSIISEVPTNASSVRSFYYLDNYMLTKDTQIGIEALLPDGTILSSETHSADYYAIRLQTEEYSPTVIPSENFGEVYYYKWNSYGNDEPLLCGPSFYISYYISGYEDDIYFKEVTGRCVPQINRYEVPVEFIHETMQDISIGIDDKSSINIVGACFEIKVFDAALGIYANSIRTFEDEFSVRLSEPNISNINGGLGIFGTYISEKFDIVIRSDYIASFGYTSSPQ